MSLQAIAGVAYDRRHPESPSRVAALRMATESSPATSSSTSAATAKQLNGALETLKRFIPTEFLALYLPFVAIAQDRAVNDVLISRWVYFGFVIATPFAVALIYLAKKAEAGRSDAPEGRKVGRLPTSEMILATIAFAVWGASVPSVFAGQQWWLAMLAMASSFVLPLVDTAISGKAAV